MEGVYIVNIENENGYKMLSVITNYDGEEDLQKIFDDYPKRFTKAVDHIQKKWFCRIIWEEDIQTVISSQV